MAEKLQRQRTQWSRWSRLAAATIGIVVAIALAASVNGATAKAQTNMRSTLDAISNESAAVTNQYLAGPETAAHVVAGMAVQTTTNPVLEQMLFSNLISATPQVDAIFVGFPDGSFRFLARADEAEAMYRLRTIDGPDLSMTESFADAQLTVLRSAPVADSSYDPRLRSWYQPIAEGAATNWTDPYIFASSGKLGVTYSRAITNDAGEVTGVVGVDLTLDDLVEFLKDRRPSENGSAQVVDNMGRVLAGSSVNVAARQQAALRNEPLEPEIMASAAPAIRQSIESQGDASAEAIGQFINGDRWGNVRAVSGGGSWYLLVEAPEADFGAEPRNLFSNTSTQIMLWSLLACALVYFLLRTAGNRILRLNTMATVDELTGLLNRAGIFRELDVALEQSTDPHDVLIAILDLDRFKSVNDNYGHAIGDRTLAKVAQLIAAVAEENNMACGRLGGDEFVIYGQPHHPKQAAGLWPKIERAVASVTQVDGVCVDMSASIGVIAVPFGTSIEVTEALHLADKALYQAKRYGGNQTVVQTQSDVEIVDLANRHLLTESSVKANPADNRT